MPFAVVTCGPAYEPIDSVRRITNFSTGELGAMLCEALALMGWEVLCLRGEMATHPAPAVPVRPFTTNASLAAALRELPAAPLAVFHAAALCDFVVGEIEGGGNARKIASGVEELKITLRPAEKILPTLRGLFPSALIVGWKYELDGARDAAIAKGRAQIRGAGADACVVNGAAYGEGLGFLGGVAEPVRHFAARPALCAFLAGYARGRVSEK